MLALSADRASVEYADRRLDQFKLTSTATLGLEAALFGSTSIINQTERHDSMLGIRLAFRRKENPCPDVDLTVRN